MKSGSMDTRGTLAVLGNVCIWGTSPVLLKALTEHGIDGWTANGLRYPFAAILFWPILLRAYARGRLRRRLWMSALVPALFAFVGQILWAWAPYYLDASLIGFLIKTSTVWAIVAAMILFQDERALLRSPKFYVGFALATVGCVALAVQKGAFRGGVAAMGIAVILGCALFFGIYAVSVRRFLREAPALLSFGVVAQYVSIGAISLTFVYGDFSIIPRLSATGWTLALSSSILGIAISHVLMYVGVVRLGASITASMQMLSPFVTYVVADLFLGEKMDGPSWVACLVLLGGGFALVGSQKSLRRQSQ